MRRPAIGIGMMMAVASAAGCGDEGGGGAAADAGAGEVVLAAEGEEVALRGFDAVPAAACSRESDTPGLAVEADQVGGARAPALVLCLPPAPELPRGTPLDIGAPRSDAPARLVFVSALAGDCTWSLRNGSAVAATATVEEIEGDAADSHRVALSGRVSVTRRCQGDPEPLDLEMTGAGRGTGVFGAGGDRPVDNTCYWDGERYDEGETFDDACNTCKCSPEERRPGTVYCTLRGCLDAGVAPAR